MSDAIWKRLPDETPKAYAAFCKYRALELNGDGATRRTIENTAALLGLKSTSGVEKWSAKFNWIERAAAWDEKRAMDIIKVQDVDNTVARQVVTDDLMNKLVVMDKLLTEEMKAALEEQQIGERVSLIDLKRYAEVITMVDNLKRRATGMPTAFTREAVDGQEGTMTYTLGDVDE